MKTKQRLTTLSLSVVLAVILGACGIQIDRNSDGSLRIEADMTEVDLQREISAALADPLIKDMTVDLDNGQIFVRAERKRLKSDIRDSLSFRLNLGTSDGHLTATISEARLNETALDEALVAVWNERIATRLTRAGQRNPNRTLQAVEINNDAIRFIWRVETRASQNG